MHENVLVSSGVNLEVLLHTLKYHIHLQSLWVDINNKLPWRASGLALRGKELHEAWLFTCRMRTASWLPGNTPCMVYRHHWLLTCAAAALPTCHTGCVDGAGMWCDTLFSFSGVHLSFWWQEPSLYSRTLSCGLCIYTITFRPCGEVKKKQAVESDRPYFKSQFHPCWQLGVLGQVTGPFSHQFLYLQSEEGDHLPMNDEGEECVKHYSTISRTWWQSIHSR